MTAPYSPSQNGVAERLNQTLVELAWVMINAHGLPWWLWFLAVIHAAYLPNRVGTKALADKTPYECWKNNRPNVAHLRDVAHLREFGVLVYILRQGQHKGNKIENKTKKLIFIGFNDSDVCVST